MYLSQNKFHNRHAYPRFYHRKIDYTIICSRNLGSLANRFDHCLKFYIKAIIQQLGIFKFPL